MACLLIYDRRFLDHDPGRAHPECPQRLAAVLDGLRSAGLAGRLRPISFRQAAADQLALVHEPAYVDLVRLMCDEGFTSIGSDDTRLCAKSYDVAALAAGGAMAACDAVMAGTARRAFCAVRPPGHHALADQAMGFCLFNNAAIAAEHLRRRHGLERVAIVDFDAHHGNGTQSVFESCASVLYVSIHERPGSIDFPGSGQADEVGTGPGRGYTLNVPLSRGAGDAEYRAAIEREILPALRRFRPEMLLLSAGFDALAADAISHLALEPESFGWITEQLLTAADHYTGGRVVSILEGGYALDCLGAAAARHVAALLG